MKKPFAITREFVKNNFVIFPITTKVLIISPDFREISFTDLFLGPSRRDFPSVKEMTRVGYPDLNAKSENETAKVAGPPESGG
jgi:hypothetical protein